MRLHRVCSRYALIVLFLLFSASLFPGMRLSGTAAAEELGFRAADKKMLFTIPYKSVPEINALFQDQGDRVVLVLPEAGLQAKEQEQVIDDEWVTTSGVARVGSQWYWYLKKRDPTLKVRSFLALERKNSYLQVVLLKAFRPWPVSASADAPALRTSVPEDEKNKISGKMARVQRLLNGEEAGAEKIAGQAAGPVEAPPSLVMSSLRSLLVLLFLVLVIVGLSLYLKRYRRGRSGLSGSGLVKVLGVETVSGKHQVMLLELLDEVLVVGISAEQMTVLTTINDPDKVEALRLLNDGVRGGRRFAGYLKGFLEKTPAAEMAAPAPSAALEAEVVPPTYQRPASAAPKKTLQKSRSEAEELPENYQEVVSQIKDRLKNGGGQRG
ncbi:MAG: flagellar biosynthetic protein FliO [Deltaproteobacteria bacterium]|nr:flagellar biosynthetic protein FliO [Deltaproteobacteria bacterium]